MRPELEVSVGLVPLRMGEEFVHSHVGSLLAILELPGLWELSLVPRSSSHYIHPHVQGSLFIQTTDILTDNLHRLP